MNSFHIGSKKSGVSKLKRSTDRGGVKDAEACEAPPSASAAGLLTLKLNDAHHLSDPRQAIYCQFTLGMQRVYSRFGGRRATTPPAEGTPAAASLLASSPSAAVASPSALPMRNPYAAAMSPSSATGVSSPRHAVSLPPNAHSIPVKKRGEVELVWDEVFNFLVEHKVKDLHVTVFLCHPVEGDKVIGTHTVKLSDCTEYETNTFCVKLAKPEGGLVWFQVKYYSLFTPTEAKEYEEYLSMISEQTFLDLFKKDRYGFALAESDMQDYKNHLRNRAKHPPTRIFTRKQWQQVKTIKEYKPLTRKGMPSGHRAEVWLCTSRAKQRKRHNKGMYWTLLEVHANESSAHTTQIIKDLSRTFPGHKVFASKKGREPLKRVLTAYAWKNSSIGYCQSMNFVAGFLLLFMDEESAFWLLTNLVEEIVPDYYSPAMIGAKADQIVFKQLLQKKLPQVHAHFEALSVPYHQVIIQWLLSLYVEFLPTETVLRVFDALLYEGSVVLLRIGLAIFKLKERALLATRDFEECWNVLKTLPRSIHDADALFKAAYGDFGSLKELKITARRRSAYREIEEQESLSNFISLRQPFRFLDGKSLIRLVGRLTELRPTLIAASVTASFSSSPVPVVGSPPAAASSAGVGSGDLTPRGESVAAAAAAAASLANNSFRVDFDTFLRVLLEIDHLLDEHHIRTLFKAFDQDTRGTVDFFELICGLSVVFNGAPLQKLMACFHAYDEDKDNRLTIKEMQLFVETHYKWLLRLLNKDKGDGTPWHVQPTVQHDTEGLWKKLRPYVEEKGGMLGFVEFRFKVANELEALQQWLETETMMPGPRTARPGRSAAAIHQSVAAKADGGGGDAKAGGAHDEDEESTTTESDDDSGDDDLRHSPPLLQPDVGGEDEELRSLPRGPRSEELPAFATSPPMSPQFLRRNQSTSVASVSSSSYNPSGGAGAGKGHRGTGTGGGNGGGAGGKKKGHDGERCGSLEPRLSADETNNPSSPRHHHVGSPSAGSMPHRLEHAVSAGGESQWLLESLKALGLEESAGSEIGGRMSGMPVMSSMPSLASAVRQPPPVPDRGLNRTLTHPRPIGE